MRVNRDVEGKSQGKVEEHLIVYTSLGPLTVSLLKILYYYMVGWLSL